MLTISSAARQVPGSGIREIVNLVIDQVAAGADIIRLEIGEPGFPTPWHIVAAAQRAARDGIGYTQSAGMSELRTAASERVARLTGLRYPADQVVITQGGAQGCALVTAAMLSPGDEVLVPDPAWPNYEMLVLLHGAVPVRYPLRPENGFIPDPADLAGLITPRTRLLFLNSPGNPTGAVYPAAVVRDIVGLAARRDVLVISDEVYDELIFAGEPAYAARYDPEHVVGVHSLSKTYAMTGWRVGYLTPPAWMANTLWRLQEPLLSCVSGVSQAAAIAALTGPQACVAQMRAAYRDRRDLVLGQLAEAGIAVTPPQGAFYLMLPLAPGANSRLAALDLVTHGVSVAPGTAFGDVAAGFMRISLAPEEEVLSAGIARIVDWHAATEGGLHLKADGPGPV
jgi:aspartate/methionine/tyrosine aminotransferase